MILGDARSGKLPDHFTAFGRALRRAGVAVDSSRITLAVQAAQTVGVSRKDDLRAALAAVMVSRQQDLGVFDEMFDAFFRKHTLHDITQQFVHPGHSSRPSVEQTSTTSTNIMIRGMTPSTSV